MAYGQRIIIEGLTVSFHPAGHVLGSAQICMDAKGLRVVVSGDYKRVRDPTCVPFELVPCDVFISEATFGLPVFRHPDAAHEIARLIESCRLFSERAHLVGAYSLGKAQRIMALLREAGWDRPIYIHGAMERVTRLYEREGIDLGDIVRVAGPERPKLGGEIVICPPSALQELWSRRFPEPVAAFASGWMRVRARARQRGVELPLVISDHADWDELCDTVLATGCSELWVTHGEEDPLVHWATSQGLAARPLHLIGYGDDEIEQAEPAAAANGADPALV
jgi:putative mRNA 3-end processing factor